MSHDPETPRRGAGLLVPLLLLLLGGYFAFAAVQGDNGVFRRVELEAERDMLRAELALLDGQVGTMRERTRRLSDDFLDLDLLDERARTVLGLVRADEVVVE
jgi:cell division protein FtsB